MFLTMNIINPLDFRGGKGFAVLLLCTIHRAAKDISYNRAVNSLCAPSSFISDIFAADSKIGNVSVGEGNATGLLHRADDAC